MRKCFFGRRFVLACWVCAVPTFFGAFVSGQQKIVTARVQIQAGQPAKTEKPSAQNHNESEVVVWLMPLESSGPEVPAREHTKKREQIVQHNKSFQPHLLVTRVGSMVDFPNRDPFFHNVFSLFDGKRFDLGLYEAGATNSIRFDHPGISFLFCNIHPEMSAVVVAVDTPYYAVSDQAGRIVIADVPDGTYEIHVWYERSMPEGLKSLTRTIHIGSSNRDLGTILVPQNADFSPNHKNKYGQDYPPPPAPGYPRP